MRDEKYIPTLRSCLAFSLFHSVPVSCVNVLYLFYHSVHPFRHCFYRLSIWTSVVEDVPLRPLLVDFVRCDTLVASVVPFSDLLCRLSWHFRQPAFARVMLEEKLERLLRALTGRFEDVRKSSGCRWCPLGERCVHVDSQVGQWRCQSRSGRVGQHQRRPASANIRSRTSCGI